MASYYFDTSALLKFYIQEEGSEVVADLMENIGSDGISILDITLLELRSAVRRRERQEDMSEREANRTIDKIRQDETSVYLVQSLDSSVTEEAIRVLDTHPLKTLDALQLAGCLVIGRRMSEPLTFVCADTRLNDAARLEGLVTLNPLDSV